LASNHDSVICSAFVLSKAYLFSWAFKALVDNSEAMAFDGVLTIN